MTTTPPHTVLNGTSISANCETDSANPSAHIRWSLNSTILQNSFLYKIESTEKKGEYNAKATSSSISVQVLKQIHGTSFTLGCDVEGQTLQSMADVTVIGKQYNNSDHDFVPTHLQVLDTYR